MQKNDNMAQRAAFGETLCELGEENERLVVLDADVAPSTHTHLFRARFPERFFEAGIAEQICRNIGGVDDQRNTHIKVQRGHEPDQRDQIPESIGQDKGIRLIPEGVKQKAPFAQRFFPAQ